MHYVHLEGKKAFFSCCGYCVWESTNLSMSVNIIKVTWGVWMMFCGFMILTFMVLSKITVCCDMTWHLQPLCDFRVVWWEYHLSSSKVIQIWCSCPTIVILLFSLSNLNAIWWERKKVNKHSQIYSALWWANPNFIYSGSWNSSKWELLDTMTKTQLLPFSWQVYAGPGSFTFGPDNIWQPYTSRRFCFNLCALGVDIAKPPPPVLHIPNPAMTWCSWTLAHSVPCVPLLIKNSHSWQTVPAVMILWDGSRPFEIQLHSYLG